MPLDEPAPDAYQRATSMLRLRARGTALFVAASLASIAVSSRASAQGPRPDACGPAITAWVAEASRAIGTPATATLCTSERVKLTLSPDGAAPLDVEVARSAEHAFVDAAGLGVSPILQVDDFQKVPASRRVPFERLVGWLRDHPASVAFAGGVVPEAVRAPLARLRATTGATPGATTGAQPGVPWLLGLGLALVVFARARSHAARAAKTDTRAAVALFVIALALRLALGAWGPLHVNGLGPLWILAAAVDPSEAALYGPGYAELFSLVTRAHLLPADVALFAANACLSAMLPAGVFAIARLLGIDARRSLVAAIALAVDPVSLRIGATESYVTPVAALTAAASLAAAAAALHAARRDRWGAGSLALAAGCFCAQAARVHPAAWIPVAMAPLTAAGAPFVGVLRPWRSRVRRPFVARATLTLAVLGVAGAVVVLTSAADLMRPLEATLGGETLRASARPSGVDRGHALTFAIAIVLAIVLLARPRWPAVLAALGALAVLALGDNFLQSPLWHAAIDRFYAVPILVGAAALAPAPLARTRAFVPVAAAAVAFLAWRASPGAFSPPTTDDQEYRWARSWLQGLPRGCRVTYVGIAGRRNAFLPTYASSPPADARRLDGRQPIRMRDVLGDVGCTFYVRTSLCSTPEGRSACDGVERQLHLDPLARASLAAVPSSLYLPYDQPRLEVLAARVLAIEDDR